MTSAVMSAYGLRPAGSNSPSRNRIDERAAYGGVDVGLGEQARARAPRSSRAMVGSARSSSSVKLSMPARSSAAWLGRVVGVVGLRVGQVGRRAGVADDQDVVAGPARAARRR